MTVVTEPFSTIQSPDDLVVFILAKILNNLDEPGETRKLSSFSTSKEIALRYAGNQGWLLEIELDPEDVIHPEGLLESAKSKVAMGSDEQSRLSEALEMVLQDKEVFIKKENYSAKIVGVMMVGSLEVKH